MHKLYAIFVLTICVLFSGQADEFKLSNGRVIKGEASSFTGDGLVIRLDLGGFSQRIPWTQFPQETLKQLAQNPKAVEFVEPFIEVPPQAETEKEQIVIKPVPRVELPDKKGGMSAWTGPAGLVLLIVFCLGNLYAAYEIALFRGRPAAMVCGISVILPVIGPILFLSLPSEAPEETVDSAAPTEAAPPAAETPKPAAGGLSVAQGGGKGGGHASLAGSVFRRGETTFNRRFFETQLAGFFRVVPSESERDLVLVFRAAKQEYIGKRISRIAANDLHLQLQTGGEVQVGFVDIIEVKVRHKDAK